MLWGFDAIASLVILYFFVAGLADGSVSSFNMGLWLGIVLVVCGVMVGSLALRSSGRTRLAVAVLLVLALPALLFVLFFGALLITNPRWN
jgi:uncharacterized membrane protein YoaK (UPF0700 family)